MGTVTKTIGTTGRDYSTLQAWEDALPANLVTDGNEQIGECYNDSEFVSATLLLTIAGITTDATNHITLRCASGQSFRDNANVQSNALRYNASNGVGIRTTGNHLTYSGIKQDISEGIGYTVIDGFQGTQTASSYYVIGIGGTGSVIQNCLITYPHTSNPGVTLSGLGSSLKNCVVMCTDDGFNGNSSPITIGGQGQIKIINCTFGYPHNDTNSSGYGVKGGSVHAGTNVMLNCACFGAGAGVADGTVASIWTSPSGYNATDYSGAQVPGSSNITGVTYGASDVFENAVGATYDLRAKSGGALINVADGTTGATYITALNDIAKTTRPQGSAWDVGAWELVSAAAGAVAFPAHELGIIKRTRMISSGFR